MLLVFAGAGVWFYRHRTNVVWATAQVPRIEALAQSRDFFQAYDLAQAARKYLPSDPTITRLMPSLADTLSVTTSPTSAQVYLKRFAPDASGAVPPRELIGATPIKNLQIARGEYVVSIEKAGYVPAEFTVSGAVIRAGASTVLPPPIVVNQNLFAQGAIPDGMVFVPGGDYRLVNWSRPTETRVKLNDFFIDRYEVSNRDFQEFIATGGYLKKQYWEHPFVKDGKTLTWEEAMKVLIDRTDLPGPRGWSGQTFPEAKADHPVTGITWYEAAAYAAFRGKQLPTIFQWEKAARAGRISAFGQLHAVGHFLSWRYARSSRQLRQRRDHSGVERRIRDEPVRGIQHGGQRVGMDLERHFAVSRGERRRLGTAFVHVCAIWAASQFLQLRESRFSRRQAP